jgi:hypothetical protein
MTGCWALWRDLGGEKEGVGVVDRLCSRLEEL